MVKDLSEPTPPELSRVLYSLAMDAASIENARDFADWCAELGYDTDSRKALRMYRACERISLKLRRLVGGSFDELLSAQD